MKKPRLMISLIVIILIVLLGCLSKKYPTLKGFYQSEVGQRSHVIQMLIREEDSSFVEWIDNREVDNGTYEKLDATSYRFKSNRQSFDIILNNDNSFEIAIKKIDNINPIIMKNTTTDDYRQSFGEWDDVEEYKSLLD